MNFIIIFRTHKKHLFHIVGLLFSVVILALGFQKEKCKMSMGVYEKVYTITNALISS